VSKRDLFQNEPLADAYTQKLSSIVPDSISYGNYTNFFTGHTLNGNLRYCIESKCYEMFLTLEELILEYLREKKEIWLFPDMKIRIFYSETLKEQIYLDYFFAMDGGSGGFFKDDPNDKSILSRFRKEAWDRNRHIKKDCSYYLKKQRKWFVDDFKRAAWNYCNFLEQQDLDDLYRYGRFCQLWCEAEKILPLPAGAGPRSSYQPPPVPSDNIIYHINSVFRKHVISGKRQFIS